MEDTLCDFRGPSVRRTHVRASEAGPRVLWRDLPRQDAITNLRLACKIGAKSRERPWKAPSFVCHIYSVSFDSVPRVVGPVSHQEIIVEHCENVSATMIHGGEGGRGGAET